MRASIIALSLAIFSGAPNLKAAKILDWIGSYKTSSSPWEVTIHKDKPPEFGYHRKGMVSTSVSPSAWRPHKTWFVFIEDDLNLWAFDGFDTLLLVNITKEGGSLFDLSSLPKHPPSTVIDRLPPTFRKKVLSKFKETEQGAAANP
jgi:hypothetical protein